MIINIEQYLELAKLADTAEECLQSLRFGSHASLIRVLKKDYGIVANRESSIREARKLCREYMDSLHYEEIEEAI